MADKTGIEWADATWNPIVGCSIVSPGCTNCYAMKQAARIEAMTGCRRPTHYRGLTQPSKAGPVWTGKLALAPDHILTQPLRWKKPRTIFVNSMGDLFHEDAPDAAIDMVFAIMALAPQHTFLVLTKRAERMRNYFTSLPLLDGFVNESIGRAMNIFYETGRISHELRIRPWWFDLPGYLTPPIWPLPNVWLGVSTERQAEADARIPHLLATPAAKRFISAEPLLGPIDLKRWAPTGRWGTRPDGERALFPHFYMTKCEHCGWVGSTELCGTDAFGDDSDVYCASCQRSMVSDEISKLDWVIAGGESGKDARPMHPDWSRGLRDQCAAAGVAFFFKQWGEWFPGELVDDGSKNIAAPDLDHDPEAWRWDFRRAEYRNLIGGGHLNLGAGMLRVGKARAGRLLDGAEHSERPQP